jgi:hypothetical protein
VSNGSRSEQEGDRAGETEGSHDTVGSPPGDRKSSISLDEISQITARLRLTPSERLRYLEDMIAFEEEARRARRVT